MTQSARVKPTLYTRKGMALRFAQDGDIVVEVSLQTGARRESPAASARKENAGSNPAAPPSVMVRGR